MTPLIPSSIWKWASAMVKSVDKVPAAVVMALLRMILRQLRRRISRGRFDFQMKSMLRLEPGAIDCELTPVWVIRS